MKPEEIHINDWLRILVGEVPASFLVELVIRALVVYLILVIAMRSMGKRMSSQLSRNELAALVSLAAAVGVPMMAPDRGLLPAIVIALVLICIERLIAIRAFKNQSFEKFSQGNVTILVNDGVINVPNLQSVNLSRERLVAQLRSQGITQLGSVRRLYMEAGGAFTLIKNNDPEPGLPTFPAWDKKLIPCCETADGIMACCFCGQLEKKAVDDKQCPNCGKKVWRAAVKSITF